MGGQPVWVQTPGVEKYGRWVIVAGVDTEYGQKTLCCQGDYTCRDYGKMWISYAYPPAHIDREAWEPCEWCEEYGDSRYKLYAGYCMQKAADDFYEGETEELKYCPNCGRPLTPEAWAELKKKNRRELNWSKQALKEYKETLIVMFIRENVSLLINYDN